MRDGLRPGEATGFDSGLRTQDARYNFDWLGAGLAQLDAAGAGGQKERRDWPGRRCLLAGRAVVSFGHGSSAVRGGDDDGAAGSFVFTLVPETFDFIFSQDIPYNVTVK